MTLRQPFLLLFLGCCLVLQPALGEPSPAGKEAPAASALLTGVDKSRLPWDSAEMTVSIRTTRPGEPAEGESFLVRVGSEQRSLVKFLKEESEGQYLLMRPKGMWIYFPRTRRAIRITPIQRLTGNTSNGDIANLPFTGNYAATLVGEETLEGDTRTWVLDLEANSEAATYPRIRLWVEQATGLAYRAHYFLASGKLIKTVSDYRYEDRAGQPLLVAMTLRDPNRPDQISEMLFQDVRAKTFPDRWFQKSYLPRMRE